MTEKRFVETLSTGIVTDTVTGKEYLCEMRIDDDLLKLLNELYEENKQLKAQLFCDDEEGICNICKHHYLVKDEEMELGYYESRCKKGHYECAREFLKHCEDFKEVEE